MMVFFALFWVTKHNFSKIIFTFKYYNNVADINDSRKKSVLNFEAQSGNYGFELTVTDNYGASCTDTFWVNVSPEPNSCPVVIIK